ncbi:MAG: FGGY-family carbohydrate kinase [Eubacteriales bacterium]|nr:FGGY-family carbohydrate kinase [Eubacteriales bacterium]
MSLLGIDLGTSNCKCVAFSEEGQMLAQASVSYTPYSSRPDWMEIDAEVLWDAFVKTVRTVTAWLENDPVNGMAVSTQGETIIPVDTNGEPICPALMNADNRAKSQIGKLEQRLGRRRIYDITGLPLDTTFAAGKIMWLKENCPDIYKRTYKFLSCEDFILMRLGFGAYSSKCLCCRMLLMDLKKRTWSREMLDAAGIDASKLSEPVPSGTLVGKLKPDIARQLGLKEGVGVATAGHDQCCSILGSGVTENNIVSDAAGTYEGLSLLTARADTSDFAFKSSINTYCYLFDGQFVSLAFFPSGFATNWMMHLLRYGSTSESKEELFARLDSEVEKLGSQPTGLFVLPHFVGSCTPEYDRRATGTIVGLTPRTKPVVLYKAIYESIAYEFAAMTKLLSHIGDYEEVRISGGGSKSDFTLRLRASLSDKKICRSFSADAVCQGAAMLAGIAVGTYKDAKDAVNQCIRTSEYFLPEEHVRMAYRASEEIYHQIYRAMAPVREQWPRIVK